MKLHPGISDAAPISGKPYRTLCGVEIKRAEVVLDVEGDLRFADLSSLGNCARCRKKLKDVKVSGRVVLFAVYEGEE